MAWARKQVTRILLIILMAGSVDSTSKNESDRVTSVLCGTNRQGRWTGSGSVRLESAALVL